MTLIVPRFETAEVTRTLPSDDEISITVRPATVLDESARLDVGFNNQPNAPILQVMMAEIWLVMVKCNIQVEGKGDKTEPLFTPNMTWDNFVAAGSALWNYAPQVLEEIHQVVREVNPQWGQLDTDDPTEA